VVFSFFESFIFPDRKQAFGLLLYSAAGLAHILFVPPHSDPSFFFFFLYTPFNDGLLLLHVLYCDLSGLLLYKSVSVSAKVHDTRI